MAAFTVLTILLAVQQALKAIQDRACIVFWTLHVFLGLAEIRTVVQNRTALAHSFFSLTHAHIHTFTRSLIHSFTQ